MSIQLSEEDLNIIKRLELEAAVEVKRICDKHKIRYTLIGGTLIGAVRHKGFIPWDDDMDLAMLRPEYNRFLCAAEIELDQRFQIVNYETNAQYGEPFTKIMVKESVMQDRFSRKSNAPNGVYIDIFPFDHAPQNKIKRLLHRFRNYELRKRILLKSNYEFGKKGIIKWIYEFLRLTTMGDKNRLVKAYRKNQQRYQRESAVLVVSLCGSYGYKKETLPGEWFTRYTTLEFEGVLFSALEEYDQVLRNYYQDYMKLPPAEQQVNKHAVEYLDLSRFGGRNTESRG